MRTALLSVLLLLVGLLLPLAAAAAPQQPAPAAPAAAAAPAPVAVDQGVVPGSSGAAPADAVPPLMAEITQLWNERQARIAELEAQFAAAPDAVAALAVEREIEALQIATELDILRLQAAHARREGREADAALIEAAIAEALAPPVRAAPAARPAPDSRGRDGR